MGSSEANQKMGWNDIGIRKRSEPEKAWNNIGTLPLLFAHSHLLAKDLGNLHLDSSSTRDDGLGLEGALDDHDGIVNGSVGLR